MKIGLKYFVGCLCCSLLALASYAAPPTEVLEQFPTGTVNWTRWLVTASGVGGPTEVDRQAGQERNYNLAYQNAIENLALTLKQLRLNQQKRIIDSHAAQLAAREFISSAKVLNKKQNADGSMEVTLEMSLSGGFAQLVLPSEIRQVESIKPLNGHGGNPSPPGETSSARVESKAYSGLIVDARGIGVSPSMVPVLTDENGQEVYGPAYVSREFAVQSGMCLYARRLEDPGALPRVAPNPLQVKGLRAVSAEGCDIVISNLDASKLRSASSHLEFLKQCRVVIIID